MTAKTISVVNLSKQYRIGAAQKDRNFREALKDTFMAPFRRAGALLRGEAIASEMENAIWALKDVSFDIKEGEVVAIIGRNGAGKSTILKVLSRITEPTRGFAVVHGRVGSLLEVGTGFHHELTGRENIYLNGAILGMKRSEISKKFDEIVAFSEVEKFIDTPVKHYSSGMYLRLAFAVAAHLEPEILIVDEVLAVGDARFQKKCLNKMQDVSRKGRTVLFVSHNMHAVSRLCDRTILLDEGRIVEDGPTHSVLKTYVNNGLKASPERSWKDPSCAPGGDVARLINVRVLTQEKEVSDIVDIREGVGIAMEYEVLKSDFLLLPHFGFFNEEAELLFMAIDVDPNWRRRPRPRGRYISTAWIPGNLLSEGTIYVKADLITIYPVTVQYAVRDAVAFQVVDGLQGESARGDWEGPMKGIVRPLLKWDTRYSPPECGAGCKGKISDQ